MKRSFEPLEIVVAVLFIALMVFVAQHGSTDGVPEHPQCVSGLDSSC